ncbi:flagellar basal body rod protein FlgC [Angustibacter sp. Root456]|jgi:flagellar basal-body rod protein FlgC|uniref:flagellar basal body rod protein FlgC n=1 Tax=Angustibacter sp. Root456 TaxID=1736539 RepID=UPI0006F305C7|nr:flagellar basal body rod C-terminal domain-containing protein [Angustibacter sp. Root456]KQX69524.1 flagellar basal-body rod protein FlgC [Angustibacter sp. Root456]
MPIFEALGIAQSGVAVYRKWLDAVSDNIANMNNVTSTSQAAYQQKSIIATAMDEGVQVGGVALGSAQGRLVYDPTHPLADAGGYVRYPDIDLGQQMGQLIMAQRGYQANLSVVDRAREAYQAALQLGRG